MPLAPTGGRGQTAPGKTVPGKTVVGEPDQVAVACEFASDAHGPPDPTDHGPLHWINVVHSVLFGAVRRRATGYTPRRPPAALTRKRHPQMRQFANRNGYSALAPKPDSFGFTK